MTDVVVLVVAGDDGVMPQTVEVINHAKAADVQVIIALNKADLPGINYDRIYAQLAEHDLTPVEWGGKTEVVKTSAITGEGIEGLKNLMSTGTSVVAGHSGVGKSSLLNAIAPKLNLKTTAVSSYSRKGVHTTSRVSLYQISDDGWVADTPGLKVLGHANVSKESLRQYYPEFNNLKSPCRFDDCCHINEPDCAVKNSLENKDGQIAKFRYDNYLRIYDSIKNTSY